jgi:hypothetical protein
MISFGAIDLSEFLGQNDDVSKVLVMIFGKIVNPTSKQSNDPRGGMRRHFSFHSGTTSSRRFSDPFGGLFTLYYGQFDSLSIFEPHFGERLKNPIFVEGIDAFCHV